METAGPDLFRVALLALGLVALCAFFAAYFFQRLYFRRHTRRIEQIETHHLGWRSDGCMLTLSLLFAVATAGAVQGFLALHDFAALEPGVVLMEFEVTARENPGLTVMVYGPPDGGVPQQDHTAIHFAPGDSFTLLVERARFRGLLTLLGQPSLARARVLRGRSSQPQPGSPGHSVASLELHERRERPLLSWFYLGDVEEIALDAPAGLHAGDIVRLVAGNGGALDLVLARDGRVQ